MLFKGRRGYIWLFINLLNIAIRVHTKYTWIDKEKGNLKIKHFHLNAKKMNCVENRCTLYKMQFEKKNTYTYLGFVETAVLI